MHHGRNMRPLQRQCAIATCRQRRNIPLSDIFFLTVPNRGGGTRKDGGYVCPACGADNHIPANHLPKGILPQLLSREATVKPGVAKVGQTSAPPAWAIGPAARAMLITALGKAAENPSHDIVVMAREAGVMLDFGVDEEDLEIDRFLNYLDEIEADLVIIATAEGAKDGWKLVFDPTAGAASLIGG